MQKFLMFSLLFVVFLGISCVQTEAKIENKEFNMQQLSPDGQKAYEMLLKAERFEQGAVGYAGTPSRFIESFNVILKEDSADAAFKSLLNEATIAGKLYALCGLYFTDYKAFQSEIGKYAKNNESVQTMSGCIISDEKVAKIVELNAANVAIIKPSQTIEDFWKTNKGGYELDIAHGGFPATFKRYANLKKRNS